MNSQMDMKEIGLAINKALFDNNSDELIRLISNYMRKNNMETTQEIVQTIPVKTR